MSEPKRVALLIASGMEYGRGLLRGIGAYAQAHGPWAIFHRVAMTWTSRLDLYSD